MQPIRKAGLQADVSAGLGQDGTYPKMGQAPRFRGFAKGGYGGSMLLTAPGYERHRIASPTLVKKGAGVGPGVFWNQNTPSNSVPGSL